MGGVLGAVDGLVLARDFFEGKFAIAGRWWQAAELTTLASVALGEAFRKSTVMLSGRFARRRKVV